MKIYIDADACPKAVKEILYRAADKRKVSLVLVANSYLIVPESEFITTIEVGAGADIADEKIVELTEQGDLVITADIPLADHVVTKGGLALNPRGELYTKQNIKHHLAMRDFMTEMRTMGHEGGGPPAYNNKDKQAFANNLDKFLTRYI